MRRFKLQRYPALAMILAMIFLTDIFWLHTLASLENRLSDSMVARHALKSVPDADIVIVDIDERSLSLMADSVGALALAALITCRVGRRHRAAAAAGDCFRYPV